MSGTHTLITRRATGRTAYALNEPTTHLYLKELLGRCAKGGKRQQAAE